MRRLLCLAALAASLLTGCPGGAQVTLWNEGGTGSDPVNFYVANVESPGPGNLMGSTDVRTVRIPWGRTQAGQITIEVEQDGDLLTSFSCTAYEDENTPLKLIAYFPGADACSIDDD